MPKTAEYRIWAQMLQRCRNPRAMKYSRYGGRGIVVCERWTLFANFIVDVGSRPTPQHTLDRRDNDGPYAPWNCRWTTQSVQNRNRRDSVYLLYEGKPTHILEVAEFLGITASAIYHRRYRGQLGLEVVRGCRR